MLCDDVAVRVRLDLAYDGSGFHGWARQPGLRTVQEDLESALATVLRVSDVGVTCAGRTDAGVHARGQVVHVDLESPIDPGELVHRLNGVLDRDVRVRGGMIAPSGFDARFSAVWRRYVYRVADTDAAADPLLRGHVLSWPRPLDERRMNDAAIALLGEHDFTAFCKRREGAATVRRLLELRWGRTRGDVVEATVRADAFCHHMVRALVGCLLQVGEGRRTPEWPAQVLAVGQRDSGVLVVPAHGLTLEEVAYPPDAELAVRAETTRTVRVAGAADG